MNKRKQDVYKFIKLIVKVWFSRVSRKKSKTVLKRNSFSFNL